MILKIYIVTIVVTVIADILFSLRCSNLSKVYGYKRYKKTIVESLSSKLLCLIIYALPIANVILAVFALAITDDWIVDSIIYGNNYYKEANNND